LNAPTNKLITISGLWRGYCYLWHLVLLALLYACTVFILSYFDRLEYEFGWCTGESYTATVEQAQKSPHLAGFGLTCWICLFLLGDFQPGQPLLDMPGIFANGM
jgi:hypothetical protein